MKKRELEAYARRHFGLDLYGFLRQKVKNEALYDYEIAGILGVSRGRIGNLRRELSITKKEGFPARFERKHGKGSVARFKKLIEDPATSLADVGNRFGFSREYARQVYREIYGCPYTVAYRRKREAREREKMAYVDRAAQPIQISKEMPDTGTLPSQPSIEQTIESRFRGIRGINCRFGMGEVTPISREIRQIIRGRVEGNRGPVLRPESVNATKTRALKQVGRNGR